MASPAAIVAPATPHFESLSHALHTCLELRQLRSFSRVLGRELSAQQYDTLIYSYEYLGSRALFFSATVAYPVFFGLRWRRRRAQKKLGEELQYWKGAAKALSAQGGAHQASAPLAPAAGRATQPPARQLEQALATGAKSGAEKTSSVPVTPVVQDLKDVSPTPEVQPDAPKQPASTSAIQTHATVHGHLASPPREVYRATADGWIRTVVGAPRGGTRRVTSLNAEEKWARAFGKGARASQTTDLPTEHQAWEALAAERVNALQWDGGSPNVASPSPEPEEITTTELFKASPRSVAKAAKIKALLRKDNDLRRESGEDAWLSSGVESSMKTDAMDDTDSAKVYPVEGDSDPVPESPLLNECLEQARREGRQQAEKLKRRRRVVETAQEARSAVSAADTAPLVHSLPSEIDTILDAHTNATQDQPSAVVRSTAEGTERGSGLSSCSTAERLSDSTVLSKETDFEDGDSAQVEDTATTALKEQVDKATTSPSLEDWTQQAERYADVEDIAGQKSKDPALDTVPNFQLMEEINVTEGSAVDGKKQHGRRQHKRCQQQKPRASTEQAASKPAFIYQDPEFHPFKDDRESLREAIGRMRLYAEDIRSRHRQSHKTHRETHHGHSSFGWKRLLDPTHHSHHVPRGESSSFLDELNKRRNRMWSCWSWMGGGNRWRHRE